MSAVVYCIARTVEQAESIVTELRNGGVFDQEISVLMPDHKDSQEFSREHHTRAPEGAVTGAGAGGVTGGVVGLLAGIGALAIPGVGPLIAAGPILAVLSGAAVGATLGGLAGGLIGLGIPEKDAKKYEESLKGGHVLISAQVRDSVGADRIKQVFRRAGAEDIVSTEKTPEAVA